MTAKEKAKELTDKFYNYADGTAMGAFRSEVAKSNTKHIALICINEIIKEHCHNSEHKNPTEQENWISYWQEVAQEIEKI